jgi:hypothetical protein
MNRRPSARTVMPGVRVVAISSSCGRRSIFEGACKTRQVIDQRIPNPPLWYAVWDICG